MSNISVLRKMAGTAEQLARYKKEIDDKIRLHRRHHTDLVYTYSEYNDGRDYLDHLQEMLVAQGIEFRPRTSREVFDKLVSTEENKYIIKLVKLVCTFLHGFKTNDRAFPSVSKQVLQ